MMSTRWLRRPPPPCSSSTSTACCTPAAGRLAAFSAVHRLSRRRWPRGAATSSSRRVGVFTPLCKRSCSSCHRDCRAAWSAARGRRTWGAGLGTMRFALGLTSTAGARPGEHWTTLLSSSRPPVRSSSAATRVLALAHARRRQCMPGSVAWQADALTVARAQARAPSPPPAACSPGHRPSAAGPRAAPVRPAPLRHPSGSGRSAAAPPPGPAPPA